MLKWVETPFKSGTFWNILEHGPPGGLKNGVGISTLVPLVTPLPPGIIAARMKRIAVLGSTGSIGCNTLDVIEHLGSDFKITALSAHKQTDKLIEQVRRHRPAVVAITDDIAAENAGPQLRDLGCRVLTGPGGLVELVQRDDVDTVVCRRGGSRRFARRHRRHRSGQSPCTGQQGIAGLRGIDFDSACQTKKCADFTGGF